MKSDPMTQDQKPKGGKPKGAPKTGGRKAGTLNKRTQALLALNWNGSQPYARALPARVDAHLKT